MSVKYIFDFDGFTINKEFKCKEVAYIETDTQQTFSYGVKLNLNKKNLSVKDRKHAWYCTNFVHGLEFMDYDSDYSQEEINRIIKSLSINAEKDGRLLAYKGGHYELDLFNKLEIRNIVNLEELGCPKFDDLIVMIEYKPDVIQNCGYHLELKHCRKVAHCPLLEVYIFNKWYKKSKK